MISIGNLKKTIHAATTATLLSAILVVAAMAPAYAASDPKGDVASGNPDFDINMFDMDGLGNPFLEVYGTAGGTVPEQAGIIYAYVFFTDDGTYAVTSHVLEDSTEVGNDTKWHTHKITLATVNDLTCVTSVLEDGWAVVDGKQVTVHGTDASSITSVMTAEITGTCITEVFDKA